MPKLLPALVLVLVLMSAPVCCGAGAQSQPSSPTAGSQRSPWLTVGLVIGGAVLGRYLARRYLSDWRIVQLLAGRAGAELGAEAAGLAAVF